MQSALTIERIIEQELNPDRLICPVCGKRVVIPKTKAGKDYGVCSVCYERAKHAAQIYEAEYLAAVRAYDAQRKENHREKRRIKDATGSIPEQIPLNYGDFIHLA